MIGKNIVVIRGNVTHKPELRYTPNKIAVATYAIAESFSYLTKDNKWEDGVNFINVATFGKLAERAVKSLDKGYAVECVGKLIPRTIQDNLSGKKYRTYDVIVRAFTILAKPRTEAQTETLYTKPSDTTETNAEQPDETNATHDEELEEEEEYPEDYDSREEREIYEDDGTFDDYLKYSIVDQMRDIAARNPAYYQ